MYSDRHIKEAAIVLADQLRESLAVEYYEDPRKASKVASAMHIITGSNWQIVRLRNNHWIVRVK